MPPSSRRSRRSRSRTSRGSSTSVSLLRRAVETWSSAPGTLPAGRGGAVVALLEHAVVERGKFRLGPLDLAVAWGERLAIAGPNGSGKTTLLDAFLGCLPLTAGERWVGPGAVLGELEQDRAALSGPETLL